MAAPKPPVYVRGEKPPVDAATVRFAANQLPASLKLVWEADKRSTLAMVVLSAVAAFLPLLLAWIGKLLVDEVVATIQHTGGSRERVTELVLLEGGVMVFVGLVTRASRLVESVLGARLGHFVSDRILVKAGELELADFETPETYDRMNNARREAGSRPLGLFRSCVQVLREFATVASFGVALGAFDLRALVLLVFSALPTFVAEAKFSKASFAMMTKRAPEGRKLRYYEGLLTRDATVKEVMLYGLGPLFLRRFRELYERLFAEERALAIRAALYGFGLGTLSTIGVYACYGLVVRETLDGGLSLGQMTFYLAIFRQGQGSIRAILAGIGSLYEDALFMSNLFGFLGLETRKREGSKTLAQREKREGIRLVDVTFTYPGRPKPALEGVSLEIGPTEKIAIVGPNGAGKTTLVKLLTGLYAPSSGSVTFDGVSVQELSREDLYRRIAVVLQDFGRYQLTAYENVALGNVDHLDDKARVEAAAERSGAKEFVEGLPAGWNTQLGRLFAGGVEVSVGQWQKLAMARAFVRDAEIIVLDEPTASVDAETEHALFRRFGELMEGRAAVLISHRFATVRMADRIVVLEGGRIVESGTHEDLMNARGRYFQWYDLQARSLTKE